MDPPPASQPAPSTCPQGEAHNGPTTTQQWQTYFQDKLSAAEQRHEELTARIAGLRSDAGHTRRRIRLLQKALECLAAEQRPEWRRHTRAWGVRLEWQIREEQRKGREVSRLQGERDRTDGDVESSQEEIAAWLLAVDVLDGRASAEV